jgi:hypothetical protein
MQYCIYFFIFIQAFDLLDMLKKEEEMLQAVKERKAKVMLMTVIW